MSEPTSGRQLIDIRDPGQRGRPHGTVPARRLLSDFLRHDLRLTGTHVGCEHGVCGACTVLARRRAGALVPHVRRDRPGPRGDDVEGLGHDPERLSPVQQAFAECHGLQCGFCTPGFVTTITAYLEDNPDPTARRPGRRSPATSAGARATRTSSRPSAGPPRSAGAPRSSRSRPAAARCARARRERPASSASSGPAPRGPAARSRATAATSTTSATTRSRPPSSAARTPTPGSSTSTSTDALRGRRRRGGSTPGRTSPGASRSRFPLLIPHPALTHAPHGPPLGEGRGEPRRRGRRHGRRPRPVRRRGRRRAHPRRRTSSCPSSSASTRPARGAPGPRRRPGQHQRTPAPGGRRRRAPRWPPHRTS